MGRRRRGAGDRETMEQRAGDGQTMEQQHLGDRETRVTISLADELLVPLRPGLVRLAGGPGSVPPGLESNRPTEEQLAKRYFALYISRKLEARIPIPTSSLRRQLVGSSRPSLPLLPSPAHLLLPTLHSHRLTLFSR